MAAGGRLIIGKSSRCPTAVCTDSRELSVDSRELSVTSGEGSTESAVMFAAIRGERVDGNDYVLRAMQNGACCALCERLPSIEGACDGDAMGSFILVGDTVEALGKLGKYVVERVRPTTVAITGSVGKTTTKQFTASVLSQKFRTLATEGNFNSEIGLPMTLLGLTPAHEAAVLELGMSAAGEIGRMAKICSPDIAVVTCIGNSHIEMLGSREAIRDAKLEIAQGLKEGGRLVLNGDEPLLAGVKSAVYLSACGRGDYNITHVRREGEHTRFDLEGARCLRELVIPTIGEHMILDAAYAAVVGILLGLSEEEIRAGLAAYETTGLRQKLTRLDGMTLIEDCYNANPESMRAALGVLQSAEGNLSRSLTDCPKGGRKIAILGDMRELGVESPAFHRALGEIAADTCDLLYTFGSLASGIAEGAAAAGMDVGCIHSFGEEQTDLLISALDGEICPGDVLLFKASRAMKLERIIEGIKQKRQI